jgi:hypothetical protein
METTMATQAERITALEALVTKLTGDIQALAEQSVEAHKRIDHASVVFNKLRAATVSALTPRSEPMQTSTRIPRNEFMQALDELRSDARDDRAIFPTSVVRERALARRTLAANTAAAAS